MNELKLLVVDDEPGMRRGVEKTLRNYCFKLPDFEEEISFKIAMAGTGQEAFREIERVNPDIVILDHKLPDIQGLDVLMELTKNNPDILVVMITAYASLEVAISATKNGAFDFLAKPFTPNDLKNIIQKAAKQIFLHRKAQKLAEERKQVRFQFISVLAHELKSPLAAVEGYLKIMDKRMLGESIDKYENMINRSLKRLNGMKKMILDLLDLTRIESGKKNRSLENVNVAEIAKESIEGVMQDAKQRGIKIFLDSPEIALLLADPGEIEIIFNNFMTNSVKYNKENGKVDVKIEPNEKGIIIHFLDTGIGMSPEEQERLFGEFVRIKNQKTRDILGSGLGLSIVKKLLNFYKGNIKVDSVPDQGTTFTIFLENSESEVEE